jgi:hypothetical protein
MEEEIVYCEHNKIPIIRFKVEKTGKISQIQDVKVVKEGNGPLDVIAKSLKGGHKYEWYEKAIDNYLGTELEERDLAAEAAFEEIKRTDETD